MTKAVAVLTTLYRSDDLDFADLALRSLLEQTCAYEVRIYLCVDGPVPDTHEDWLTRNGPHFAKVLRNTPRNLGLALTLNRLIDEALEDEAYVFRMDMDDIALPDRFAKQIDLMETHLDISLCGGQLQDIDNFGTVKGLREFPTETDAIVRALGRLTPLSHPTFCFRRDIFEAPTVRYPVSHLTEDIGLIVRMVQGGYKLANHPDVVLQWRQGPDFFVRRRDLKRGLLEMGWHLEHLRSQNRLISSDLIYICAKIMLRLLPERLVRRIYASGIRRIVMP